MAEALGIRTEIVADLHEIDRRVFPILSPSEHRRLNERLFVDFDAAVVGRESAREAQRRFTAAVQKELRETDEENLVIVAHGTVISLFVSAHNPVDAAELWRRLQCPSYVALERSSGVLVEVVAEIQVDPSRDHGA